jgi:hypothetical protein
MSKEYPNGFWLYQMKDLDKLKRILLQGATNETSFTQWAISEAIENKRRSLREPTRAEIEAAEALLEEL